MFAVLPYNAMGFEGFGDKNYYLMKQFLLFLLILDNLMYHSQIICRIHTINVIMSTLLYLLVPSGNTRFSTHLKKEYFRYPSPVWRPGFTSFTISQHSQGEHYR